jgi:formylglycine-generating enzyme required for sulfatase activity
MLAVLASHKETTTMRRLLRMMALTYLLMLASLFVAAYPFKFSNPDFDPIVKEIGGIPMVYVPEGCFPMGTSRWERDYTCNRLFPNWSSCRDWTESETPQHEVCLSEFWISQTEVTNAQYAECVNAGVCEPPICGGFGDPNYANHPVVCVDWHQAGMYAEWLSNATGQTFSLPTEAQWEYAARGPAGSLYPWGNERPICELANFYSLTDEEYCVGDTTPAGSYPKGVSWVGALDMAGNVFEGVSDWYNVDYYATRQNGEWDPIGPESSVDRVVRGGSWFSLGTFARAALRDFRGPDLRDYFRGFRVVCAPPISPGR